jgi:hypothetical protein
LSSTPDGRTEPDDELADKEFELSNATTSIGRTKDNDLVIPHRSISSAHAQVTRDASTSRYRIRDLESSNGVRVNGKSGQSIELEDGDIVDLGHVRMRFESREHVVFEEPGPASLERVLIVGEHPVTCRDEVIRVGDVAFRVEEVRDYAQHGANLPLPKICALQAALALFVTVE